MRGKFDWFAVPFYEVKETKAEVTFLLLDIVFGQQMLMRVVVFFAAESKVYQLRPRWACLQFRVCALFSKGQRMCHLLAGCLKRLSNISPWEEVCILERNRYKYTCICCLFCWSSFESQAFCLRSLRSKIYQLNQHWKKNAADLRCNFFGQQEHRGCQKLSLQVITCGTSITNTENSRIFLYCKALGLHEQSPYFWLVTML